MRIVQIALGLFFAGLALSQTSVQTTSGGGQTNRVTKIIHVRYGNAQKLAELAAPGMPVTVNADNVLQVVVLKGQPDAVSAVEQTIRTLDVPGSAANPKDVELTIYVIGASDKPNALAGTATFPDLVPVIKQLRAIFPYRDYQVLSSMLVHSSEGRAGINDGLMRSISDTGNYPTTYSIRYENASVAQEGGASSIHLHNFQFKIHTPVRTGPPGSVLQQFDVTIATDVDLREGQKVVVGKANVDNSDLALFVVLTARLVD